MGSPPGHVSDREPSQVDVTITLGFWMGKTEVTQEQWTTVMRTEPWKGRVRFEHANCPATFVGWVDARTFCSRLTERERRAGRLPAGWEYRIPSEAEWEYACRAGTTTIYNFGDDQSQLEQHAWWGGNPGLGGSAEAESYAHEAANKETNRWGLNDMTGNVWEWCLDCYQKSLPGGRDPVVHSSSTLRVGRGGSWRWHAKSCRSAYRSMRDLGEPAGDTNGMRVTLCKIADAPDDEVQSRRIGGNTPPSR